VRGRLPRARDALVLVVWFYIMNSMSEMHAELEARNRARHVKDLGQATLADDFNQLEQQLDVVKEQAA
jgi:hypothetical protein